MRHALTRHPDTPCAAVSSLTVEIAREGDALRLIYVLEGELSDIVVPHWETLTRVDELWRTTCFEAFVRPADGDGYFEFNFAPASAAWAAYQFDAYRAGMRNAQIGLWESWGGIGERALDLNVALASLPPGPWRLGLSAVIEEKSGAKSYWALAHPPGKPDFHHQAGFVLDL